MARRVMVTDRPSRQVALNDAPARRVSLGNFSEKIGAEIIGSRPREKGSALSYAAVRDEMFRRLRSSGGRPGLEGVERKKIPLAHADWERIERIANEMAEPDFHPSPGQVASILLGMTLSRMDASMAEAAKRNLKWPPTF